MDNSQLKRFLTQNMELLRTQNYDKLYELLPRQDRYFLTNFLLTKTSRNPLDYMSSIPDGMYDGVQLPSLIIPEYIMGDVSIKFATINSLTIENIKGDIKFYSCTFDSVTIAEGRKLLASKTFEECYITKIIKLPKSIRTLEKNAFESTRGNFIIATPKREAKREQLVINTSEESFYREKLRWLRDKENSTEEPDGRII